MKIKLLLIVSLTLSLAAAACAETYQTLIGGAEIDYVNNPAAKFEEYRSLPRGFFLEKYALKTLTPSMYLTFTADKVGRIDQSYNLLVRKEQFDLALGYDQIPHNISFNAKTIYANPSPDIFTLPLDLRTYLQNHLPATSPAYYNALNNYVATSEMSVILGTRRDKLSAKADLAKDKPYNFDVAVEQERKTGAKAIGASLGFSQADELPEPVNYTTTNVTLHKGAIIRGISVDAKYRYSTFQDANTSLTWDNPSWTTDTASQSATGRLSLPPNNLAQAADLSLASDLPMNGRLIASFGYDTATQNNNLLPYTSNSAITIPGDGKANDAANVPQTTAQARVDTLVQQYLVDLNPSSITRLDINVRSAKVQNLSTPLSFPGRVAYDNAWTAGTEETGAHFWDTTKNNYDLDFSFILPRGWTLGAGYGLESINYLNREVSNTNENTLRTSLRGNLSPKVAFRGSFLVGARRMDNFAITAYQNETTGSFEEHPGLRRSDVTDRNRQEASLALNIFPYETVNVGFNYRVGAADYLPGKGDLTGGQAGFSNEMYGLLTQRNDDIGVNFDFWLMEETLEFVTNYDKASVHYQDRSNLTSTAAVTQNSANDWVADTLDTYDTLGFEINRYLLDDRVIVGLSYLYSAGHGQIILSGVSTASPPNTSSIFREFDTSLKIIVNPAFSVNTLLAYEQFDSDDWAVNNVPYVPGQTASGAPSPNGIFLGNSLLSYHGLRAQIGGKYSF